MQVKNRLDALTTLRFFAAAAIVVGHADDLFRFIPKDKLLPFNQGVSFFFVLSGFILTWNYPVLANWSERLRFWSARFARIWPLHVATCLLWIALVFEFDRQTHFPGGDGLLKLATNLLLLQAWVPVHEWILSFNGVSWSISAEVFFYAMFPVLIALWSKRWHQLLLMQALLVGLLIYFAPVSTLGLKEVLYFNPIARIFEFSIGIGLAFTVRRIVNSGFTMEPARWFVVEVCAVWLLVLGMLMATSASGVQRFFGEATAFQFSNAGLWPVWFLVIGVFAMSQGPVAKVLTLRLGVFLGEISFALYLCHAVLIHYLEGYRAQLQSAGATGYLLFWVACILLATLLFLGVETPWRRYILSRIGNKAPQAPFLPFFKATEWVSVLGLLLVSGTALYCLKYSTIVPLQPEEVANFMAQTTTQRVHLAQRVTIDGRYELLSMQMDNGGVDRGEVHVRFLLRANQVLHASDLFAVHLNQPDGTMKANFDRRLDFGRVTIPAGTTWIHKTSFPIALLKGADNLGVAMYAHPSSLFGITGGNTDWGGKRLIVPFTYDAAP